MLIVRDCQVDSGGGGGRSPGQQVQRRRGEGAGVGTATGRPSPATKVLHVVVMGAAAGAGAVPVQLLVAAQRWGVGLVRQVVLVTTATTRVVGSWGTLEKNRLESDDSLFHGHSCYLQSSRRMLGFRLWGRSHRRVLQTGKSCASSEGRERPRWRPAGRRKRGCTEGDSEPCSSGRASCWTASQRPPPR